MIYAVSKWVVEMKVAGANRWLPTDWISSTKESAERVMAKVQKVSTDRFRLTKYRRVGKWARRRGRSILPGRARPSRNAGPLASRAL